MSTEKKIDDLMSLLNFIGKKPVLVIKSTETKKSTDEEGKTSSSEKTSTFEVKLEAKSE